MITSVKIRSNLSVVDHFDQVDDDRIQRTDQWERDQKWHGEGESGVEQGFVVSIEEPIGGEK